jgi:predicted regulator of Ras-like GTPase activity (Roadblock/LC7/MglB family)
MGGTLDERLRALRDRNADITAAVVVTADGLPIAADAGEAADADVLAAVSAELLQKSERASTDAGTGPARELLLKGDTGYLLVVACGPDVCLACSATLEAALGMLLLDVHRASQGLESLI